VFAPLKKHSPSASWLRPITVVIIQHFWYYQNMDKTEPVIGLYPLNDCVLVELKQSTKNFTMKEGKYDSRTEGIVIAVPEPEGMYFVENDKKKSWPLKAVENLIGKRVHFEEFKEGARIKRGGTIYSFIKIEDIRGYENE
jgi:co-chaperonin GroES (HSP10)